MKPEILHEDKLDDPEKKPLKIAFFIFDDPFIVKIQSEKYFSIFSKFY